MVSNITFKVLLDIDDIQKRSGGIRKMFTGYTAAIDITGFEVEALVILVNLSYKRNLVDNLCDIELAKRTLKNTKHIEKCINEVNWLHSHNLKYPDIRVSKQRIIAKPLSLVPSAINSSNCTLALGWSHDSAMINFAKMFVSHFCWQGELTCLAELVSKESIFWRDVFSKLGITFKDYKKLSKSVRAGLPDKYLPDSVDMHSVQVQFPYKSGYMSITPVVSHSVQSKIQQLSLENKVRHTTISHTRPSSVSELVSSLGGHLHVLHYPPYTSDNLKSFSDNKIDMIRRGKSPFYREALLSSYFTRALDSLIYSDSALTHKKRRRRKLSSYKQIRVGIRLWLSPIIQWRFNYDANGNAEKNTANIPNFIYQLLIASSKLNNKTITDVFNELNRHLAQKYAYHPKLILPLKGLLLGVINKLFIPEVSTRDAVSSECYLYLKKLNINDAQALSNPYCLGLPSLTAIWGMLHKYQRRINDYLNINVRLGRFSWFIRQYSTVKGSRLPAYKMKSSGPKYFKRPVLLDERFCDMTFDIVIKVYGDEGDLAKFTQYKDILMAALPATFAGGTMLANQESTDIKWCEIFNNELELYKTIQVLPNKGLWVVPVSEKITSFDELVDLLNEQPSYLPTMTGFSFLEEPKTRKNAVELQHCYAEPLIGLAQLSDGLSVKLDGMRSFFRHNFWRLESKPEHIQITKSKGDYGVS